MIAGSIIPNWKMWHVLVANYGLQVLIVQWFIPITMIKSQRKKAVYIRQDGYEKNLAVEKNKANKRFICLAWISLPLARYIYGTMGTH